MLADFVLPIDAIEFGVDGKSKSFVIPKVSSLWNFDKWLMGVHWKSKKATFSLIFVKRMIIMIDFLNMVCGCEVFNDITDRELCLTPTTPTMFLISSCLLTLCFPSMLWTMGLTANREILLFPRWK
ncbi:hypothetical protein K2173_007004 [Erythroxylum novogranatense]|uniref:Uncharacterized protein n=1 Tax=Erythroxylum novogranatense TaxID=1862640 RepID=A0AAV8SZH8_9ROSI|nr:hypothetical protein K2173_007004 [Erythroxylum novogranatense]